MTHLLFTIVWGGGGGGGGGWWLVSFIWNEENEQWTGKRKELIKNYHVNVDDDDDEKV